MSDLTDKAIRGDRGVIVVHSGSPAIGENEMLLNLMADNDPAPGVAKPTARPQEEFSWAKAGAAFSQLRDEKAQRDATAKR